MTVHEHQRSNLPTRLFSLEGWCVTVVVNHLHFRDPLTDDTAQACRDVVPRIVAAVPGPPLRR